MKNFIKFLKITLTVLLLCFSLKAWITSAENNTEKAVLIEKYLVWHKEDILKYTKKYKFSDDEEVINGLSKIDVLIYSLQKIQNNDAKTEEKAISIILDELKKINSELELILKIKKEDYDKILKNQKIIYADLWKKLWAELSQIHSIFSASLKNKTTLTEYEQKLKNTLEIISLLSNDVKNFWIREFDTIEEMQSSFLGSINSIKYYILVLKNIKKN